jgi:hypothetical protein
MVTMTVDAGVGVCGAMQSWGRSFCLWLIPMNAAQGLASASRSGTMSIIYFK